MGRANVLPVRARRRRRRPRARRRGRRRRRSRRRSSSTPASTGRDDRPPSTPWHETVIYEVHVKGFTKLHPDVPRTCAAPTRASRPTRRSTTCSSSASPPSSCCPCTTSPTSSTSLDKGLTNYWGYNSIGFFAPHAVRRDRRRRRAGARVQGDGQGAAPRRHRGDPRRRLQPHRRGQPPRPDALVQGHRQPVVLPARPRGARATTWTTPARATRSTPCTRRCCG